MPTAVAFFNPSLRSFKRSFTSLVRVAVPVSAAVPPLPLSALRAVSQAGLVVDQVVPLSTL